MDEGEGRRLGKLREVEEGGERYRIMWSRVVEQGCCVSICYGKHSVCALFVCAWLLV